MWIFDLWHTVPDIDQTCQTLVVCQFLSISREPCSNAMEPQKAQDPVVCNRIERGGNTLEEKADLNILQGLSAVLYSLDPEQNKLLEVLLSITIDFYLTKVNASQLDT